MKFFPLILFFLLIISCSVKRSGDSPPQISEYDVKAKQEISAINSKILQHGSAVPSSPADYLIGPADLLEIKVFESEELSSTVRVSSRGFVTLPLVGDLQISDLTAREAEQKIEDKFKSGGYLRDPHITIFVSEHRSGVVTVAGAVKKPGSYELLGRQTVLDALANSRGIKPEAGKSLYLNRRNRDGSKQSLIIDIDSLVKDFDNEANVQLKPGDLIYVPDGGNVFVEGAVNDPGSYTIKEGSTTISHVIAMSGGLRSYASKGNVRLIRYQENGKRKVYEVDLDKINKGDMDDPVLQDRDAVIVDASGAKRLLYGLKLSLGFGLVGVGYDPPDN